MTEEQQVMKARFSGAAFFDKASEAEVFVGGVGGIGSFVSFLLSRIVNIIHIYDDDVFDTTNLAGQLAGKKDIGISKVFVARDIAANYGTAKIYPYREKVTEETDVPDKYVFACFDNMAARKLLFEKWAANPERELYVEARLLMSQYEVYAVQKGQEDRYRETLFDDSEVEEVACTLKQTSHFSSMCASRMVQMFCNYLSQEMFHSLPFHVSEEGDIFHIEIKD